MYTRCPGRAPTLSRGACPSPSPLALSPAQSLGDTPATGSGHSASMIALTSILSILFAILLAGLVAMLVFWG